MSFPCFIPLQLSPVLVVVAATAAVLPLLRLLYSKCCAINFIFAPDNPTTGPRCALLLELWMPWSSRSRIIIVSSSSPTNLISAAPSFSRLVSATQILFLHPPTLLLPRRILIKATIFILSRLSVQRTTTIPSSGLVYLLRSKVKQAAVTFEVRCGCTEHRRGTEAMMKTHYDERGKSPFLFENTQWWVVGRSFVCSWSTTE